MNTKLAFVLVLFALLSSLLLMRLYPIEVKAPNSHRVHNLDTALNYTTIQEAINDVATSNGHTIFVEEGIYYEHVVVGKSLSLVGENQYSTIIDGNGTDTVVHVTADSVTIRRFSIKNGSIGIHIDNSSGSLISENSIIDNYGDAVLIDYSTNCNVYSNVVGNNTDRGILVTETQNFIISGNTVYGSKEMYGINANSSTNGLIARNNVYENAFDGIGIVSSSICTVVANNVNDNPLYGIYIDESSDSFIYHNNIVNNSIQAAVTNSTIHWDDGIEGNYWSDYNGTDA
ncbi:MAG: right-handed parallel beta-helix repeat-containing protein, partial [Candidatus Bathyarchaeota archaeon]|nr:right-handed parallel beta-helix repeat-containing protein [Candidatus Bathyarchaeota archaeon]